MPEKIYSAREVERGIRKLTSLYVQSGTNGFDRRPDKERWGWYYVDGKEAFDISAKIHSSGDVGRGRIRSMRKQMRLDRDQFAQLCQCSLSGSDYHKIILGLVEAGVIVPGQGRERRQG